MKQVKLRGQTVDIDTKEKILYMKILKPNGKTFSISDRIVDYVNKGYAVHVEVLGKVQIITNMSKCFKEEEVTSKFAGYQSWYRYWFMIDNEPIKDKPKQESLW